MINRLKDRSFVDLCLQFERVDRGVLHVRFNAPY